MSEQSGIENKLYRLIKGLYSNTKTANYNSKLVTQVENQHFKVAQEKRNMERTLRFSRSKDHVPFAVISPSNNVLPLLSKQCKSLVKGNTWLLFDKKRNYGILYQYGTMELITLNPSFLQNSNYNITLEQKIEQIGILAHIKNKIIPTSSPSVFKNEPVNSQAV